MNVRLALILLRSYAPRNPVDSWHDIDDLLLQSILGSTSELRNIWSRMASTAFGIGLMTVSHDRILSHTNHILHCWIARHQADRKLVRNMAPPRTCHWWHTLSRPHGDQRCDIPCPSVPHDSRRYS